MSADEPWLAQVRARAQRPTSARHVARPTVAAAAPRPASARAAVAAGRGVQWAEGTSHARRRAPRHSGGTAAHSVRECDVGKTTYSVRERRVKCSVVAGRQPFTPRPAVQRHTAVRVAHPPDRASAGKGNRTEDQLAGDLPNEPRRAVGNKTGTKAEDDAQQLRVLLGLPDETWAFAPSASAGPAPGRRRLLMPTWARLAQRVELMEQQNREASELLTGLASSAAAPVRQHPTVTAGADSIDAPVLPDWPEDGPFAPLNPREIATGWRGTPEPSRRQRSAQRGRERGRSVPERGARQQSEREGQRGTERGARQQSEKEVTVMLQPGRDWAKLVW